MRVVLFLLLTLVLLRAESERPPNIVMILADDLGSGDLGCFRAESKIPTPNLDKLAASGMRFTKAYCPVSICSPTRYALMTGAYPWRSWKKRNVLGNWDRPMITADQMTLPGFLKREGYFTAGFGKWHLGAEFQTTDGKPPLGQGKFKGNQSGANIDIRQEVKAGPLDRGFDRWSGMICPSELIIVDDRKISTRVSHPSYEPVNIPGLSELPEVAVPDLLPRITRQSVEFITDRAKDKEKPFFLYFAPYVPHIPLAVKDEFRGKTKAGDYGDYVHELDHHIGLLLDAIAEAGLRENTLILFASDNGSQFPATGEDHHPNGELRGGKWSIYEGGVRTALIASWPARIAAGSSSDAMISLNDVLATVSAAIGRPLPAGAGPDSLNLLPVLLGEKVEAPIRNEVLMRASSPESALRQGNWKYIKTNTARPAELYDLATDPQEKTNLAEKEPERFAKMAAHFEELMREFKP